MPEEFLADEFLLDEGIDEELEVPSNDEEEEEEVDPLDPNGLEEEE